MLPAQDRKRVAEAVTGRNWSIPPTNPVHVFPVNRMSGAWEPETNAKHWRALVGFLSSNFEKARPEYGQPAIRLFAASCLNAIGENDIDWIEREVIAILDRTEEI